MIPKMHEAFYNHVLYPKFQEIFQKKNCKETSSQAKSSELMPFPYRSILVLNGEIPNSSFFSYNLPIIAVDGAANQLLAMGIQPKLVIGDLDSIYPNLCSNLNIIHTPDQDYCDFSKALEHLIKVQLLPSIIVGINGGAIDHILQNINIFLSTGSIFYAPPIVGHILQPGVTQFFSLKKNTKISLLGIPTAQISTKGLKWELNSTNLTFPGPNSCFNRSLSDYVSIKVHTGACLAMIYLEPVEDAASLNAG